MAIQLKANNGNITLTSNGGKVIRGIDGGYYTPVIDAEGNLTWIASLEDMNDIAAEVAEMKKEASEEDYLDALEVLGVSE